MIQRYNAPAAVLLGLGMLTSTLAGCANDGALGTSNLTTAAVTPVAAPKVDPACVTLAAQIDQLRQEGTIDRLQQASQGKSASVQVKRASLAKQADLNRVNAEFQAKCATIAPKASTAAAAPPPVAKEAAAAAAAAPVATPAKKAVAAAAPAAKTVVKKVAAVKAAAPAVTAASPVPAAAPVVPTASRVPDVVVSTIPPQQ